MACVLDIAGEDNPNLDELFKPTLEPIGLSAEEYAKCCW